MRERDTVWIDLEDKQRPGVVIEVQPDLIRVAYGTSQPREWLCEVVTPETRQGRVFPLVEPTYFFGRNTCWELPGNLRKANKPCAWELFFAIRKLVEEYDATLAEPDA